VDFNEGDISEAKRDAAAVKPEAEKLKMNLLYFETYNRRKNLKFFGIRRKIQVTSPKVPETRIWMIPAYDRIHEASHVQFSRARVEEQQR